MAYATQQDLIDRFGEEDILQLADRDEDGAIDAAVTAKALADADALIDGYVGKRHDLPLAQVPPLLTRLAVDLAYFFLFRTGPTEDARKAYDAAQRFLRDIASGAAVLDVAGSEPARDGQVVLAAGPTRVFDRDTLKGF